MPQRQFWQQLLVGALAAILGSCFLMPSAQGSAEQVWLDYKPSWDISQTTRLLFDLGLREQLQDDGYLRLVLGTGVTGCGSGIAWRRSRGPSSGP